MLTTEHAVRRKPLMAGLALGLLALASAHPAYAQQAGLYTGTNSLGQTVSVHVVNSGPVLYVIYVAGSGNAYCHGKLIPGHLLGGSAGYPDDAPA